jgi:hypothetical protein
MLKVKKSYLKLRLSKKETKIKQKKITINEVSYQNLTKIKTNYSKIHLSANHIIN